MLAASISNYQILKIVWMHEHARTFQSQQWCQNGARAKKYLLINTSKNICILVFLCRQPVNQSSDHCQRLARCYDDSYTKHYEFKRKAFSLLDILKEQSLSARYIKVFV